MDIARRKRPKTFRKNILRFTGYLSAFQIANVEYFHRIFLFTKKAITWMPTMLGIQVLDYVPRGFDSLGLQLTVDYIKLVFWKCRVSCNNELQLTWQERFNNVISNAATR